MSKNLGGFDRVGRVVLAMIIAVLLITHFFSGIIAIALGAFAAVFLLTSFIGFCPLYTVVGLSTKKKQ